jgi:acyl-CoA synthetase (NDP forming)
MKTNPLRQIMYASSIAVWGASSSPMKMGTIQLTNLLAGGFPGKVFVIHPKEQEVLGLPVYRSILDVGEPVDLAMLVLPTRAVPEVLTECGQAGIKSAIIVSGGFKEMRDEDGKAREREIVEIARRFGIRFVGPNCLGILNSAVPLITTTIPEPPLGGSIAMASQSGAYTAMIYPLLHTMGMRIHQTVSVGNEADIDLADCLDYFREEESVHAVGLYIETIRRPRAFIEAARACARVKPVVAIYVGGNEAGSRAGLSHTGAVAGSDELYSGILAQAGVVRAEDMDEMLDWLWALSTQPRLAGRRVAVISNSGGPSTSLAYHMEHAGLEVPLFSPELQEKLRAMSNPLAFVGNPIDLTFDTNVFVFKDLLQTLFDSGEVDGAVLYGLFGSEWFVNMRKHFPVLEDYVGKMKGYYASFLTELDGVSRAAGKPFMVMSFLSQASNAIAKLTSLEVPVYPSARRCASAMRTLMV